MNIAARLKGMSHYLYDKGGFWREFIVQCRRVKNIFLQYWHSFAPRSFMFRSRSYRYFYHRYNRTWLNERTVEIPLGRDFVKNATGLRVLEVGNVLSHYMHISHDVLDKYETAPNVINEDVVAFKPRHLYDRILSLSTLEHVGWDEHTKEQEKVLIAIENLKRCLTVGGVLFVTMPLGYNSYVDAFLEEGRLPFETLFFLKRTSALNDWKEVEYTEVRGTRYGVPFEAANAIVIGIYTKK